MAVKSRTSTNVMQLELLYRNPSEARSRCHPQSRPTPPLPPASLPQDVRLLVGILFCPVQQLHPQPHTRKQRAKGLDGSRGAISFSLPLGCARGLSCRPANQSTPLRPSGQQAQRGSCALRTSARPFFGFECFSFPLTSSATLWCRHKHPQFRDKRQDLL